MNVLEWLASELFLARQSASSAWRDPSMELSVSNDTAKINTHSGFTVKTCSALGCL